MVGESSKYFKDASFPLRVIPNRTSVIDKIDDGKCDIHEAIEIKLFYEGTSTLLIGNKTVVASAGDVIVINPYEFHATISYSEEKGKYHLFMVGLDFFPAFPDGSLDLRGIFFSDNKAFVNCISDNEELKRLLLEVVDEWTMQPELYKVRLRGLMTEVVSLLIRQGMNDSLDICNRQRIKYHATIEPAIRMIRNEYKRDISLSELAQVCCVNKYYFCRIFKSAMGITPMQYLYDYRLNNADIIIRNTEKNISNIISECGFNDESYFYRCYKKRFGDTPLGRRTKNNGYSK